MNKATYDKKFFQAIGDAVARRRNQLELSVFQLAVKCDLSVPYIQSVEAGRDSIYLGTFYKICLALNCVASDLIAEAECQLLEQGESVVGCVQSR